jgi:hypothetical protein
LCALAVFLHTHINTMESYPFLLEEPIAERLIRGIETYNTQLPLVPGYYPLHPFVYTTQHMKIMMCSALGETSCSKKVMKIALHASVAPHLDPLRKSYQQSTVYNAALADAVASIKQRAPGDLQISYINRARRESGLCIGQYIKEHSSYRCPTEQDPDPRKHLATLLELNTKANTKEDGVYIAGVYALFLAMQERERALDQARRAPSDT